MTRPRKTRQFSRPQLVAIGNELEAAVRKVLAARGMTKAGRAGVSRICRYHSVTVECKTLDSRKSASVSILMCLGTKL